MESYIRQIQSIDVVPMLSDEFTVTNCNNIRSDTSKRKREDCGLEDIRLRVENLIGLANDLVNRDKSCQKCPVKPTSFGGYSTATEQSSGIKTPSRIPRRSLSCQESQNLGARSRSATPQRVVQNRIQFFEALSQNRDVYKTILSQERQLGIERTSIPISVHNKVSRHSLNVDKPQMPLFNQVTPTQDKSIFVFAAPPPVRSIPRLVGRKHTAAGFGQTIKRKIAFRNPDTPSKIPVLDKSKFFAGDGKIPINRKTG